MLHYSSSAFALSPVAYINHGNTPHKPSLSPLLLLLLPFCCCCCRSSYMQVAFINEVPLFYSDRDNHWFPTLRILHQYPDMMPKLRTDKGAIKFVLSGANIMCPGLTSPGATIHDEVRRGQVPIQMCWVDFVAGVCAVRDQVDVFRIDKPRRYHT
jgi:predicted RNA-binding protein (TIGR00451 family)